MGKFWKKYLRARPVKYKILKRNLYNSFLKLLKMFCQFFKTQTTTFIILILWHLKFPRLNRILFFLERFDHKFSIVYLHYARCDYSIQWSLNFSAIVEFPMPTWFSFFCQYSYIWGTLKTVLRWVRNTITLYKFRCT